MAELQTPTELHNLTSDKIVFCYREDDLDSLEVALAYQSARNLPDCNLVPLPCSEDAFITESEYQSTIETPLLEAIQGIEDEYVGESIWCIILGYHVPIGYGSDEYNYKAIASRLHRLRFDEQDEFPNFTYDRKTFKFFDEDDASGLYITAVINAPTKDKAISLINRAIDIENQQYLSGKVYMDPYGLKSTQDQIDYETDILEFVNKELPSLGLQSVSTKPTLNSSDPAISAFKGDSFYWGWYTPRYSPYLFLDQNERRAFLYNADDDSASGIVEELDENGSDRWCNIAINKEPGYACCAGSVSVCGETSYLRPRPFFEALRRGAGIGEAFLYSSPVVDWKTILIGDPLMGINFPSLTPDMQPAADQISNQEGIKRAKEAIETALAYGRRQTRLSQDLLNQTVLSNDLEFSNSMLYEVNSWANYRSDSAINNLYSNPAFEFVRYIRRTSNMGFAQWLSANEEKTTEYMRELISSRIPNEVIEDELIYPTGSWQYEFTYIHPIQTRESVYFELEVSTDSLFADPAVSVSSLMDIDGWEYESELEIFTQITSFGLLSNFSGRRVRYYATELNYLDSTEFYNIRWRAIDGNGIAITDWQTDTMVIRT